MKSGRHLRSLSCWWSSPIIWHPRALLLPVLARSKQQAQGTQCLGNSKQLLLAWTVLCRRFQGGPALTISAGQTPSRRLGDGIMSNAYDYPDNTNSALMMSGQLGAYTKNPAIYQCPADPTHRVRSYSMDFTVGDKSTNGEQWVVNEDYWPNFLRMGILRYRRQLGILRRTSRHH